MSFFYIVLVLKNLQVQISGSSSLEVCCLRTHAPSWSQGEKPPVSSTPASPREKREEKDMHIKSLELIKVVLLIFGKMVFTEQLRTLR